MFRCRMPSRQRYCLFAVAQVDHVLTEFHEGRSLINCSGLLTQKDPAIFERLHGT